MLLWWFTFIFVNAISLQVVDKHGSLIASTSLVSELPWMFLRKVVEWFLVVFCTVLNSIFSRLFLLKLESSVCIFLIFCPGHSSIFFFFVLSLPLSRPLFFFSPNPLVLVSLFFFLFYCFPVFSICLLFIFKFYYWLLNPSEYLQWSLLCIFHKNCSNIIFLNSSWLAWELFSTLL